MKILLVNPPTTHTARYPGRNRLLLSVHEFSPPLGLMYLKSYLKKNTPHDIRLFNFQVSGNPSMEDFKNYITDFKPEIVGITSMLFFWYDICETAKIVKSMLPRSLVILGGAQAWHYPEDVLGTGLFDIIVQGEGEITMAELTDRLGSKRCDLDVAKKKLRNVKGILYMDKGKLIQTPPRPVAKDPDIFPFPDRTDINIRDFRYSASRYHPSAIMIASRGCPFHCTFCANQDRFFRPRKIDRVIEEVLQCREMGYRSIDFFDDNLLSSKKHVKELCGALIKNKINMPWMCRARVDKMDRETVSLMAEAGCEQIHFGVETATQKHLDRVKKGITPEKVRNAFALAKEAGITTLAYFMFGFPDETIEDAKKTIDFAFELEPDFVYVNTLIPPPGTKLYQEALRDPAFGGDYFREFALRPKPNLVLKVWPTSMTEKEILDMQRKLLMGFYFRPKKILQYLTKIANLRDLFTKARIALKLLLAR